MRLLHTADWHLGRVYHDLSLLEDQSHLLDQFVELVRQIKPDAVPILLRKPQGEYDGYVWSFAMGRAVPGETPEHTARREVLE